MATFLERESVETLRSRLMQSYVRGGEAFDVSHCERTADGDFVLPRRMHPPKRQGAKDYLVVETGQPIWSIGKNKKTGSVIASVTGKFYQRPGWECVWLR